MDKHSCWAWRRTSTRAETGTGMAGEEAAPTFSTASIASWLLYYHQAWGYVLINFTWS